jgi:thiol:disulfide interchange protein DsbD
MKMFKLLLLIGASFFVGQVFAAPSLGEAITTSNPLLLSQFIASHSMLLYLGLFFVLGILLAFTPCVLPMVPILSGIIVKKAPEKSFKLSLSYVLGMALMYAVAGMAAGFLGASLQSALQNPIILTVFSLLFIILGLNLLGVFEFQLPQFNFIKNNKQQGSYFQTALMGALSTLIVSPCVTAPLIGVLSYIGQTQQVLLGGLILFVLALGMGVPLLLVGAGQGRFLPKTGPWMNAIKAAFGFMMFAMAIYLSSRFLPLIITSLLWSALIIGIGLYVTLKNKKQHKLIYIFSILISALGVSNVFQSIAGIRAPVVSKKSETLFKHANTVREINSMLKMAKANHQKVFLEFFASWCSDCTAMDSKVFSQKPVQHAMQDFLNIRVDITEDTEVQRDIKKKFHIFGTPTLQFYNKNGELQNKLTAAGYVNKKDFLALLKKSN